jgi:uncharacterized protein (TIGR03083 family)
MSKAGLAGFQLAGDELITLAGSLTDDEWHAPSAAEGWSVQDVVAHAGSLLTVLIDAVNGELVVPEGIGIEALNDIDVAKFGDRTADATTGFLRAQLAKAVRIFTPLQEEPFASTAVPMVDLGTYPLHSIVDMFTFDFTTHLHLDILAPRGPITRETMPLDEARLGPAVSWLLGGIPQMQPGLAGQLAAPLGLILTGPAATSVVLSTTNGTIDITPASDFAGSPAATVTSATSDFLAWSTTRLPWRALVTVEGEEVIAEHFLDALNLI